AAGADAAFAPGPAAGIADARGRRPATAGGAADPAPRPTGKTGGDVMSLDAARLYALLPAIHRIRDAAEGEPLRDLVALFARELEALEEDIEQLYDDQFVETCADWVVPYIGDLIGYRPLAGIDADVASPRAEVANTIAYRRRKGTALMLEQLARDLLGRPAHVTEFFEQLATTQYMKHLRPHAVATADLRSQPAMRALGGAFNTTAHTPD